MGRQGASVTNRPAESPGHPELLTANRSEIGGVGIAGGVAGERSATIESLFRK